MKGRLNDILTDKTVVITELVRNKLTPKLMDMGLYPGKHLKVLFKAPFGDPIAIDVEGYVLSLRLEEAALILVKADD